ncbi:unnamed protein product [Camellia sinensis]
MVEAFHEPKNRKKGFKVFSVGFNCNLNSPKFQSSIFGTVVPGKSSHLQLALQLMNT